MSTPPQNTPDEQAAALVEALLARKARSDLKTQVKHGTISVGELLDTGHRGSGDMIAGRMQVGDLVEAVDGIGDVKTAKALAAAGITDATEHLDELTADQVAALKVALAQFD